MVSDELVEINKVFDHFISQQKRRWAKQLGYKNNVRAEEVHRNISVLRTLKLQVNEILDGD